jgi:hypothetical protein
LVTSSFFCWENNCLAYLTFGKWRWTVRNKAVDYWTINRMTPIYIQNNMYSKKSDKQINSIENKLHIATNRIDQFSKKVELPSILPFRELS